MSETTLSTRADTVLWSLAGLLCLVGLGVSVDLTWIHWLVHTDPYYQSFCAVSETINCDTVAESRWAVFLGVPVSVWGILGYLVLAAVVAFGFRQRRAGPVAPIAALVVLAGFSSLASITLGVISFSFIHAVCVMCLGSYLVNLALFGIALALAWRQTEGAVRAVVRAMGSGLDNLVPLLTLAGVGLLVALVLMLSYPDYWGHGRTRGPGGLPVGVTEDGAHWIGAVDPKLTIEEYSDYECPHCRRGHQRVRQLVKAFPRAIRLVHRHYPLDHNCNPMMGGKPLHLHACRLARLAVCAGDQDKFWECNDYIFEHARKAPELGPTDLSRDLGLDPDKLATCMAEAQCGDVVLADLNAGFNHRIRGTPSFVVDGETYTGSVPKAVVEAALGVELLED